MRRTRHVVLPVKSWQYIGLMVVSLACLTLGLVSRDRGGRSESLAGPELKHSAPHDVDACPNVDPFTRLPPYDESANEKDFNDIFLNTQTFSDGSSEKTRSMLTRRNSSIRNRRSFVTDRSNVRSGNTEREVSRLRSRRPDSISDRSSRSRSAEFRDESSRTIGHVNRQRRSSTDDRRRQETSVRRNIHTEKQRLTLQSNSERRREDHIARSRVTDTNRRERSNALPRHSVRSANTRDIPDERFSRLSRSRDNRAERNDENRRSNERLERKTPEGRLTEHQRVAIERSATKRTEGHESRVRLVARSLKPTVDTRQSRSADLDRAAVKRIADRSQKRAYIEQRERDSRELRNKRTEAMARTSERNERRMDKSEARGRSNDDFAKSRIARVSSRRSADRPVGIERMQIQSAKRSDVRRIESQTRANFNQRDESPQRVWVDSLRRNVRSTRDSESRGHPVRNERLDRRDVSRERRTTESSSRSETFAMNSSRRRSSRAASKIGERREASTEKTIARELRTSSNERHRRSTARMIRQETSRMNSLQQRTSRISRMSRTTTSERPHRLVTRDVSAQRADRFTEIRPNARKLETPNEIRRETSAVRKLEQTAERISLRRDTRSYGTTRTIENREREERTVSQDRRHNRLPESTVTQELRGRSVGAAITRTLRVSREQNGVDTRAGGKIKNNDYPEGRYPHDRRMINARSRTIFMNIPDFTDLGEISKTKNNEYVRQAIVLVLCAIYGASLLKGKGGSYSFRKIFVPMNRFVAW